MMAAGYSLSPKSKNYHALDSFVYEYQNAGGVRDNLKTDLLPVLHHGERFELKATQKKIVDYLLELLILREQEQAFIEKFRNNEYRPELLFGRGEEVERIAGHPMAVWKCGERQKRALELNDK